MRLAIRIVGAIVSIVIMLLIIGSYGFGYYLMLNGETITDKTLCDVEVAGKMNVVVFTGRYLQDMVIFMFIGFWVTPLYSKWLVPCWKRKRETIQQIVPPAPQPAFHKKPTYRY